MDSNGSVTVTEAAQICCVSDDTIRRRLRDGAMPSAARIGQPNGPWRIPISDLVAAGLSPRINELPPAPVRGVPSHRRFGRRAPEATSSSSLEDLQAALAEATERAIRAEALAEARADHATALIWLLHGGDDSRYPTGAAASALAPTTAREAG